MFELDQRASLNLINVLSESNRLLNAILIFLIVAENRANLFIKSVTTITYKQNLERFLNCHGALEGLVVHQELCQVEQFAGFEANFVRDAPFVHSEKLFVANVPIEVIIDFPDDQTNFVFGGLEPEELERFGDVHVTDLPLFGFRFGRVLLNQVLEDVFEALALDGSNGDSLEDLGR